MQALLLAALVTSSTIAVRIDEAEDLPLETALDVAIALARTLEAATDLPAALDRGGAATCGDEVPCSGRVPEPGREVVAISVFGGPLNMRLIARRLSAPGSDAEVNLSRDRREWGGTLEPIARALFPEGSLRAPPRSRAGSSLVPPLDSTVEDARPTRWWPIALLGGSAAAAITGAVLGVSSAMTAGDLESRPLTQLEYDEGMSRVDAEALGANVLVGAALVGGAVGCIVLLFGD